MGLLAILITVALIAFASLSLLQSSAVFPPEGGAGTPQIQNYKQAEDAALRVKRTLENAQHPRTGEN